MYYVLFFCCHSTLLMFPYLQHPYPIIHYIFISVPFTCTSYLLLRPRTLNHNSLSSSTRQLLLNSTTLHSFTSLRRVHTATVNRYATPSSDDIRNDYQQQHDQSHRDYRKARHSPTKSLRNAIANRLQSATFEKDVPVWNVFRKGAM